MSFVEIELVERESSWSMSDLQSHDYYELYFLLSGEREFYFENKVYKVGAGSVAVIPPFAMHKTSGGGYRRVNINISQDLLSDREVALLSSLGEGAVYTYDDDVGKRLTELLMLGAGIPQAGKDRQMLATSIAHTVIYLFERGALHSYKGDEVVGARVDADMLEIASYLRSSYAEAITLAVISERFYIPKNTLCAKFRRAMGSTVMEYLAFVRLSRAKELLQTTDYTMERISEMCGYSSANYFSMIFKKGVGISPREYRKKN